LAAEPGEAVVVIYNTQMPESKEVADHYAARRHVPDTQVIGFKLSTTENITRGDYRISWRIRCSIFWMRKNFWCSNRTPEARMAECGN